MHQPVGVVVKSIAIILVEEGPRIRPLIRHTQHDKSKVITTPVAHVPLGAIVLLPGQTNSIGGGFISCADARSAHCCVLALQGTVDTLDILNAQEQNPGSGDVTERLSGILVDLSLQVISAAARV